MGHATTPPVRSLDAVITAQATLLTRLLPRAIAGDVAAVHRSRVASRRLRETLPLAAAVVPGGAERHLRRDLRRITRALGRVRELDVATAVLNAESRQYPAAAGSCAGIARAWERERDAGHAAMAAKLSRVDLRSVGRRLEGLASDVASAPRAAWTREVESRVRSRASALAERVSGLGVVYVPERLHAARIAAKKLRYSLEIARDAADLPCTREINELVQAQDLLGEWHDLLIVQNRIQSVVASRRGAGARAIAALIQHCDAECRDKHARFLTRVPHLVDLCAHLRRRLPARKMLRIAVAQSARRHHVQSAALRRG